MQIWLSSQKDVDLIRRLNQSVVAQEESVGTLFRGNSLASKVMDQYMKLVAMEYLHETLGDPILHLCEEKRTCEMDSTRGNVNVKESEKVFPDLIFQSFTFI